MSDRGEPLPNWVRLALTAIGCTTALAVSVIAWRPVEPESPAPRARPAPPPDPAAHFADVASFTNRVLAPVRVCDDASAAMEHALGGYAADGGSYRLFERARHAEATCRQSRDTISAILAPPALSRAGRGQAEDLTGTCKATAIARIVVARQVAKIADGDGRPSVVAGAREAMELASRAVAACALRAYALAEAEHLDLKHFAAVIGPAIAQDDPAARGRLRASR